MRFARFLACACAAVLLAGKASAAMRAQLVADGFHSPIFAASPSGDSRLFVAEQGGAIRILDPASGRVSAAPFLTVPNIVSGGEQGLLGLAFHPGFASNGYFYVNVTRASDGATEIRRYHATSATSADAGSGTVILAYAQPFSNHNGGWLGFGPDGYLYIAAGDGGSGNDPGNNAQNTNSMLGKILRIDVDHPSGGRAYGIPSGNPFASGGGAQEVWTTGCEIRGGAASTATRAIFGLATLGRARAKKSTCIARARRRKEFRLARVRGKYPHAGISDTPPSNAVGPVHDYTHAVGQAVIGGSVFRKPGELSGLYVFGDEGSGRVWTFRPVNGAATELREWTSDVTAAGGIDALSSFAEDDAGDIYAISLNGPIYRLVGDANGRPTVHVAGKLRRQTVASRVRLRGGAADDVSVRRVL